MKFFGAGFGGDVDQRGRFAAELGSVTRFLNLELLNGVDRRVDDQIVEILVGDFYTIDEVGPMRNSIPVFVTCWNPVTEAESV